jgi:hypothetical protein
VTEREHEEGALQPAERQLSRELELLISGALVFALLQLPGHLDAWWNDVRIHLTGATFAVPFAAYYIGKLASYGLIATIAFHFLLRGLWVALLGLRGAFPGGIDESRTGLGPFMRGFYSGRLTTLQELERRVDRVAATLFSFVFLFLALLLGISIWSGLAGLIAFAVARLTGKGALLGILFWSVFGAFAVAQTAISLLDRRSKKHELSPRTQRFGTGLMRLIYYGTLNFLYAPIFFTFASQVSRKVITTVQVVFLYALIAVFAVTTLLSAGVFGFDNYAWFPPNAGREQIRANHYEELRDLDTRSTLPTVQSQIITEPYVRLFVPYDVRRDNEVIRRLCPDVPPLRTEGFFTRSRARTDAKRTAAALQCFDRVYSIELDGKRLNGLEAAFFVHPDSGLHGRLMMIPTAPLPAGKHELIVRRNVQPGSDPEGLNVYSIAFWK